VSVADSIGTLLKYCTSWSEHTNPAKLVSEADSIQTTWNTVPVGLNTLIQQSVRVADAIRLALASSDLLCHKIMTVRAAKVDGPRSVKLKNTVPVDQNTQNPAKFVSVADAIRTALVSRYFFIH
jgi:hypothetical protein